MFRRAKTLNMVAAFVFTVALSVPSGAMGQEPRGDSAMLQPSPEIGSLTDDTPRLWFVELSSSPTTEGTSLATVRQEKVNFRAEAARAGLR